MRSTYTESNEPMQTDQKSLAVAEAPESHGALYFLCPVNLPILIREVVDTIHAPGAVRGPWSEIEASMYAPDGEANSWLGSLPAAHHLEAKNESRPLDRHCTSLAFLFIGFDQAFFFVSHMFFNCFPKHLNISGHMKKGVLHGDGMHLSRKLITTTVTS